MSQEDPYRRALAAVHEAMLDDAHWPLAAALIDSACGMRGNALVVAEGRLQADYEIVFAAFCSGGERRQDQERSYFDRFYPTDEHVPRVLQLPDSRLVPIADLYTEEELKTSSTYNTALRCGGYQNGLNVRLDGPNGCSIVWTLADSKVPGGWRTDQVEMVERFLPHIRQFVACAPGPGECRGPRSVLDGKCWTTLKWRSFIWIVSDGLARPTSVPGTSCGGATGCSARRTSAGLLPRGQRPFGAGVGACDAGRPG